MNYTQQWKAAEHLLNYAKRYKVAEMTVDQVMEKYGVDDDEARGIVSKAQSICRLQQPMVMTAVRTCMAGGSKVQSVTEARPFVSSKGALNFIVFCAEANGHLYKAKYEWLCIEQDRQRDNALETAKIAGLLAKSAKAGK